MRVLTGSCLLWTACKRLFKPYKYHNREFEIQLWALLLNGFQVDELLNNYGP